VLGVEPNVRGGEDVLFGKRNFKSIKTKTNRRGGSSLFQEKNKTHFGTNCLTDRKHNKVSKAAQDKELME
jgi:hypothetical protein